MNLILRFLEVTSRSQLSGISGTLEYELILPISSAISSLMEISFVALHEGIVML